MADNRADTGWSDDEEQLRQRGANLTRSGAFAYAALYEMQDDWDLIEQFRPDDPEG